MFLLCSVQLGILCCLYVCMYLYLSRTLHNSCYHSNSIIFKYCLLSLIHFILTNLYFTFHVVNLSMWIIWDDVYFEDIYILHSQHCILQPWANQFNYTLEPNVIIYIHVCCMLNSILCKIGWFSFSFSSFQWFTNKKVLSDYNLLNVCNCPFCDPHYYHSFRTSHNNYIIMTIILLYITLRPPFSYFMCWWCINVHREAPTINTQHFFLISENKKNKIKKI